MESSEASPVSFDGYSPAQDAYDEFLTPQGDLRPWWRGLADALQKESRAALNRRWEHANRIVQDNGVIYNAFKDTHGGGRPWQIDLLPLVIDGNEWNCLAAGVAQRAELLSLIIDDVYGAQQLWSTGELPPELLYGHQGYHHQFRNLTPASHRLSFFGCEVARSLDGRWWAMADRTSGASGVGYALENRLATSRIWPNVIRNRNIHRLAPFFRQLQQSLANLSPRAKENPRVALLTPGAAYPSYFEDVYLARYLGYTLVEGGDLAVRDDCVFIKTLDGLLQIDVILSRVSENELDPLELRTATTFGASGLLQAIRKGNVAVANAPGCGFVESPVLMAFLPKLCRTLMGAEMLLPSIATWWCGEEDSRKFVIENLPRLVLKPAFEHSGGREIFGDQLDQKGLSELSANIRENPTTFVAQEIVQRSSAPVWSTEGLQTGHVALRTFAIRAEDRYQVMPGALARVTSSVGPMQLAISAGDGSKDVWVMADKPVEKLSLLPSADKDDTLRRNSPQLPSRVADNLLWLGRHLDRAEITARLLRVIVDRLAGERDAQEIPELGVLIRVLAAAGQIEPDYAIDGLDQRKPGIESRLPDAIFDSSESHSLRSTVDEIARLASTVRDRLSHDTWRAVRRIDEQFSPENFRSEVPIEEALTLLDQLVIDLAVVGGLLNDGMVRGPAWRFIDIGRRMERALFTVEVLGEVINEPGGASSSVLDAVLDVNDLQVTYRARYMAALRVAPVLDLLIADESNPRSLLFQLLELKGHVDALPSSPMQVGLRAEEKTVLESLHQLRMIDVTPSCCEGSDGEPPPICELLNQVKKTITTLSTILNRKYLVHSGDLRRI